MRAYRKMNRPEAVFFCLLIVTLSLLIHGCGGTFRTVPNEGDVNGNWNLSLFQSNTSVRATEVSITQKERYGPFSGTSADNATLTGTLNRENITITLNNSDGSVTTLTGVASEDWKSFSGTYTSTGSNGTGTWGLAKSVPVPPGFSVTPQATTLSCTALGSKTFTVTGGTPPYSVSKVTNPNLVNLDTTTTTSQFTVTSLGCTGVADGTVVTLNVTDTSTNSKTVLVTISNP